MKKGHLIVTLPSSTCWKKAERVIEDVAPTKFLSGSTAKRQLQCTHIDSGSFSPLIQPTPMSHNTSGEDEQLFRGGNICLVCSENQARYTCPQCQIPYCSIECFRNHTRTASSTFTNEVSINNNTYANSCSEHFFKRKVTSLMQLESIEKEEKAHRALNRYHHQNSSHEDLQEPLEGYDNEIDSLYELQSHLENLENNNKELSHRELAKILPSSLKAVFEKDLRTGQFQADWILTHWHPWWKRELVENGDEVERDERDLYSNDENLKDSTGSTFSKILDERLLRVPKYESFGGGKCNDDILVCNLIDILYGTSRTLRLYHGVENASRQAPVEAATTLISTSSVLAKDKRFNTIYQVLNHHYNNRKESFKSNSRMVEDREGFQRDNLGNSHVYIEDIASMVTSPRMVGRALLEASDIFKAAIKKLKVDHDASMSKREESRNDYEANLKQIRRLRKKLQFFLSWATRHPVAVNLLLGGDLKADVLIWIDERKQIFSEYEYGGESNGGRIVMDGCLDSVNKNAMKIIKLHPSGSIPTATESYNSNSGDQRPGSELQQPLLVEVQSRRKNVN